MMKFEHFLRTYILPYNFHELRSVLLGPKVLANSMPKAGTHLLLRVLSLFPSLIPRWSYHVDIHTPDLYSKIEQIRKGQFLSAHLYWTQELSDLLVQHHVHALLIIRDLRDIAISNAYYITYMNPDHRLSSYFKGLNSDAERLMASIVGIEGERLSDSVRSRSIGEHAMAYVPWLNDPNCLIIRFEDLIGSHGGGNDHTQLATIKQIAGFLDITLSDSHAHDIAKLVYNPNAQTFRKGTIGDWRNHFDSSHKKAFQETAGKALSELGYSDVNEWET